MLYTVYKITNHITNKIYIGAHRTDNLDDGYMGSGKIIRAAIQKYGLDNFTKEIIEIFESEQQMFDEEKVLISKYNPQYNIREGGAGGFTKTEAREGRRIANLRGANVKAWKACKQKRLENPEWVEEIRQKRLNTKRERYGSAQPTKPEGWKHSEESKAKIGAANRGKKGSQTGSMWITDGTLNKKIKAVDPIPEGWYKGRIMKDNK